MLHTLWLGLEPGRNHHLPLGSLFDPVTANARRRVPIGQGYCASIHLSDPVNLADTSTKEMCRGFPSTVPS
jgi:hypothetical protein